MTTDAEDIRSKLHPRLRAGFVPLRNPADLTPEMIEAMWGREHIQKCMRRLEELLAKDETGKESENAA